MAADERQIFFARGPEPTDSPPLLLYIKFLGTRGATDSPAGFFQGGCTIGNDGCTTPLRGVHDLQAVGMHGPEWGCTIYGELG